jgi:LPXTG-motif cell wall-anchored protein
VTWTQTNIPLQAKGSTGEITYSFAERATVGGDPLCGFISSGVTDKIQEGQKVTGYTFTARNTQIKYTLQALKQSENRVNLPGAEFTVYKDYSDRKLTNPVDTVSNGTASSGADGLASITGLTAVTKTGTSYYIRETKAPAGYSINQSIYKLDIEYNDSTKPYEPSFKLTQIIDENGDEVENSESTMEWTGSMNAYTVTFRCIDECVYELPQSGGRGIIWSTLLGTVLMMTAVWLFRRKRNMNCGA